MVGRQHDDRVLVAGGDAVEEGAVGEAGHVVEEEGTLRGDALHVGVLVLHRAGQHRVVDVPDLGHAATLVAVQHALCRGRAVDHVVRSSEKLGDQLAFGHLQRFDLGREVTR